MLAVTIILNSLQAGMCLCRWWLRHPLVLGLPFCSLVTIFGRDGGAEQRYQLILVLAT